MLVGAMILPCLEFSEDRIHAYNDPRDGNDGLWSTFAIRVGNPAQDVRVHVSTSRAVLRLPTHSFIADPIDCIGGGLLSFDKDGSTTWQSAGFDDADDYGTGAHAHLLLETSLSSDSENAHFGSDYVTLALHDEKELILKHEVVASFATDQYSIGSLGLAPWMFNFSGFTTLQSSIVQHFPGEYSALSASYGYTAGAVYKDEPVHGSLTLGGYDTSRTGPENLTFDLWPQLPQDLPVSIKAITTGNESLLASSIVAHIDSSISQIWLPVAACERFEEAFGLTWNEEYNLYIVNETSHETLLARNASVTFTLSSVTDNPNSTIDIVLPYASFDLEASYPLVATHSRYFPVRQAKNESQYTLGRAFLQESYLIVDYDRSIFSISQALFPAHGEGQSIVPIYRPYNVVSSSGRPQYNMGNSIAVALVVGIGFFVYLCLLYIGCALILEGLYPRLLGKPFKFRLLYNANDILRKLQYRPITDQDHSGDISAMTCRNVSLAT
ncbi:hypothetical protein MMC11_003225 [Xylographa trunciseda]|nr:hypothetical protein [Xylographa trunciseda]